MIQSFQPPERLFRYFSPGYSQIFAEQKLWFSTANQFNDIFEAFPRYDQLIEQMNDKALRIRYAFLDPKIKVTYAAYRKQMKEPEKQMLEDSNEECPEAFQTKFSEYYGMVCFTENLDSLLMWGHYTDCHKGFVVEFKPQHSLFTPRDFGKVIYAANRPVLSTETSSQMLLCKSPEWAYEKEWRLIKKKSDLSQGTYRRNNVETKGQFIPLPMDSIMAVYFGCRTSKEVRDVLLNSLETYPSIERYFVRRNRIAYKLDVVPWKEWKEPIGLGAEILKRPWPATID